MVVKATQPGGLVVAHKKGALVDPHLVNSQRPSVTVTETVAFMVQTVRDRKDLKSSN